MATPTSNQFTDRSNESAFTRRNYHLQTTEVYLLRPPQTQSTSRPWIITRRNNRLYHPLTSKPHSFNFPRNFDFSQLHPVSLAVSYAFDDSIRVDKLLKLDNGHFFALYGGGQLQACPRCAPEEENVSGTSPWFKLFKNDCNFDDITVFRGKIYAVDREGLVVLIHCYKYSVEKFKTLRIITSPVTPGDQGFGWRKRFAVDEGILYLVVRVEEESFQVYMMKQRGTTRLVGFYWELLVRGFEDKKVLFMARDYYFFRRVSSLFPGKGYNNCIVFSEAAFPEYRMDCWEFTETDDGQLSEDDIAAFWFDNDEIFAREGKNSVFPKIDWSPPAWIFDLYSLEREPDEDEGLDSDRRNKNDGEDQSSTTESYKSDSSTTKFEGFDVRSDLVQTLQRIWQKQGNIIIDSTVRSGDIVARALESLATMVRILEDNPAQSLSDGQADYLSSTLADLKCIRFKVCWLGSFVEKVLLVHKSKPLFESLNNLIQLSSQVDERKAILLDKVAKLDEEKNKLKEEMAQVSENIPFSGQVKFDEPVGAGLA